MKKISYRKRLRLGMVGIGLIILFSLQEPATLLAHTNLVAGLPAPGTLLTTAPGEIRLNFGEPNEEQSRILLYTSEFRSVSGVVTSVNPVSPQQLIATLPTLAPDTYTVQWIAVAKDKHVLRGSYTFAVQPQDNRYLWLSLLATIAIWVLILAGSPWRKNLWRRDRLRAEW